MQRNRATRPAILAVLRSRKGRILENDWAPHMVPLVQQVLAETLGASTLDTRSWDTSGEYLPAEGPVFPEPPDRFRTRLPPAPRLLGLLNESNGRIFEDEWLPFLLPALREYRRRLLNQKRKGTSTWDQRTTNS